MPPRCSGQPPAILSFPTRRSSDLPDLRQLLHAVDAAKSPEVQQHVPPAKICQFDRPGRIHPLAAAVERDRKSTHLNSSHLGISYAVFCLKKKTLNDDNRTPSYWCW